MNEWLKPIWLFGAGGHARVIIDAIAAEGKQRIAGALDDNISLHGSHVDGVPIVDAITTETIRRLGIRRAILAIGDNRRRANVAQRLDGLVEWAHIIHPQAHVGAKVSFGEGTVIMAGAIVQTGTRLGKHVIINTGATVDHDSLVNDFAHIAPGAHLAGNVVIGAGSLVGIGASVVNGTHVGSWGTLGAGAVAAGNIPDNVVAVGIPARWERVPACLVYPC